MFAPVKTKIKKHRKTDSMRNFLFKLLFFRRYYENTIPFAVIDSILFSPVVVLAVLLFLDRGRTSTVDAH